MLSDKAITEWQNVHAFNFELITFFYLGFTRFSHWTIFNIFKKTAAAAVTTKRRQITVRNRRYD